MIDGVFVINPIAHAYDLSEENIRPNAYGRGLAKLLWQLHYEWNPPELRVPQDVYMSDWPMEALARTMFLESPIDMAANMNLRLDSWFLDGLCSREKNVEAAERWPNRFFTYVGVDPTQPPDVFLPDLEDQMRELPGSVGLKLYPDRVDPLGQFRMDDPKVAYPLFERALELGIKTVAIHKAVPNGPVPIAPYRVDDIDGAAIHFPELNFEIVHSGLAFADETALAIARFPNVYANLEITSLLLHKAPGLFNEIIGLFLMWAGPEKIIYSDGTLFCHSRGVIEKLWKLELSDHILEKYGLEQWTHEDKALILGGNYARMIGVDIEEARRRIADDEFSRHIDHNGYDDPYSNWLRIAGHEDDVERRAEARVEAEATS
jgi:predicted TIM-barrel fold metal-dependent hydrolase